MLILNFDGKTEYIQIGQNIRIHLLPPHKGGNGKQTRIGIEAPKHIPIVRNSAVKKEKQDLVEFDPSSFDYTFCASPHCVGKCGRKMSKRLEQIWKLNPRPVSFSFFCEEEK